MKRFKKIRNNTNNTLNKKYNCDDLVLLKL